MGETAFTDGEAFWKELLDHIVTKLRPVPKFQVERVLGPMLDYFLRKDPGLLGGDMEVLAPEFPLKKKGKSLQSTNVDWLLYDRRRSEFVLLELKTDDGSFSGEQFERYLELAESIAGTEKEGGICSRLRADLVEIQAGARGTDYSAAIGALDGVMRRCDGLGNMGIRVLYLAPRAICARFRLQLGRFRRARGGSAAYLRVGFRSFGRLRRSLPHDSGETHSRYRDLLCDALCVLDGKRKTDTVRNSDNRSRNYEGVASLEEVLARCRGEVPIIVGFDGGRRALELESLNALQQRRFKWDWVGESGKGVRGAKDDRHWIGALPFVELIREARLRLRNEMAESVLLDDFGKVFRNNPELLISEMVSRAWPETRRSLEHMTAKEFVQVLMRLGTVGGGRDDSPDDHI